MNTAFFEQNTRTKLQIIGHGDMSNLPPKLDTIDLDSLTMVTGGAVPGGGENGGPAGERPRKPGLSLGQKIFVGVGALIGGLTGEDVVPRPIKLPPPKPPSISRPKFLLPAIS